MSFSRNRRKMRRQRPEGTGLESLESRKLLSSVPVNWRSLWTIRGDTNPADLNDIISVVYNPTTRLIDVSINGVAGESRRPSQISSILIISGAGDDTITVNTGSANVPVTVRAGDGNDTIRGGSEVDTIDGGAGNDTIDGGGGSDRVGGGEGDDTVIGGLGKDAVNGGGGSDTLYAVKGKDTIGKDRFDAIINSDKPTVAESILPGPASNVPPIIGSDTIRQRLIEEAVARYRNILGTTYVQYPFYYYTLHGTGAITLSNVNSSVAFGAMASDSIDYSGTNTQVDGVDESDLVETDGSYIYALRRNMLTIIDVRNPNAPKTVSTTQFSGNATGLYLVGNRAVVLTDEWQGKFVNFAQLTLSFAPNVNNYYQKKTSVWVFDVAAPADVKLLERTTLSGALASSRVVGDQLYLIMRNDMQLPPPVSFPTETEGPPIQPSVTNSIGIWYPTGGQEYRYQTEDEYRQWLNDHVNEYLPWYTTTLADGTAGPTGSPLDNIQYLPDGMALTVATSVLNFDLGDDVAGPAAVTMAAGAPDTVYASGTNLYVLGGNSSFYLFPSIVPNDTTHILKFNLGKQDVHFDAAGDISGRPLNSYSMDEYQGQLRVVTAARDESGHETHSLYVLTDTGNELTITGTLNHIGDDESLRSVLFMQDRAFVVTFRVIDPLFAIDLSNPNKPLMVGELVMPGFSTYLYPLNHDHIIGIGQAEGAQAGNFHTVQVSLYNVANLSHPYVVEQRLYDVPGQWGSVGSEAGYDPHAFSYFAQQGVLAIPLTTWANTSRHELLVLKVDPARGFTELGSVSHDTPVQRSLRIGDNLYSLAQGNLKIVQLLNPGHVLADLLLPDSPVTPGNRFVIMNTIFAPSVLALI